MKAESRFETIVKEYSQPLYWHIRRMVVCHEDAQDILQDTFSTMFLHLWQLKDTSKLKSWLYTIATNKASLFLKKKALALKCEDISKHLADMLSCSEYVDYEKAVAVDLNKALLELPRMQQLVFNLRFFDELEYEDISRIAGITPGSARVNYHLAKSKLIQYINEEQL